MKLARFCGSSLATAASVWPRPRPAEPDLRLAGGTEWGAGEAGEFLLRGAGRGAADLLAVDEQGFAAVVFLKGEDVAVRKLGFCESDSWFHGA